MPRYLKRIWAGDVYEEKIYFSPRERGMSCERAAKENLSTEKMEEYNCMEARRKCARMVNANFRQGDLFLTLTFRERVDVENALRLFRNFISRLKRLRKRKGYSELKYLYVVESKRKREHIHLLINKMELTMKELSEVWGLGRVMVSILEPGGDYTGLAFYITKENYKEYGKRWSGSRNLAKPKEKVMLISKEKEIKRARVPKNYKVIEDISYFSEYTGKTKYLRAVKIGGEDYGNGKEGQPHMEHPDGEG